MPKTVSQENNKTPLKYQIFNVGDFMSVGRGRSLVPSNNMYDHAVSNSN
jgi:hypothetical protein